MAFVSAISLSFIWLRNVTLYIVAIPLSGLLSLSFFLFISFSMASYILPVSLALSLLHLLLCLSHLFLFLLYIFSSIASFSRILQRYTPQSPGCTCLICCTSTEVHWKRYDALFRRTTTKIDYLKGTFYYILHYNNNYKIEKIVEYNKFTALQIIVPQSRKNVHSDESLNHI